MRAEAGFAVKHSGVQQKHVAEALGMDHPRVSRICTGKDSSAVSRFYDIVRSLVLSGKTDAGHLIHGAMLVAEEAACELSVDEVRRRYMDACSQETLQQSHEDVATHVAVVAVASGSGDEREALEAQDAALRHEGARHVDVLVYNRAYRVLRGWRARA